ncbi:MAG: hypothetical protein GX950_01620 [Candidatus Diapherotrites archaeon]|jgi:hypothetical protein|uniref:Uncharacterized protein n=1 Tax=Candidatus Iainarchaeum sp. TaxID=3101447 RepID=A0A7K4BZ72_9ARCH|nr:hypothetical protein [Candidatus Diapherotrites archaeon]
MIPFFGKKEEKKETAETKTNKNEEENNADTNIGKYNEPCGLCSKAPTDKKWGGQYFHKKCLRKMKKMAKGMI